MRILASGLLLGAGVVAATYGLKIQITDLEINKFIVMGLAIMSLGLFALRVNVTDPAIEKPATYVPANQAFNN